MFQFLRKKQVTKSLGPSVDVNRVWIKRNDHASKNECVDFFSIWLKRVVLDKFKMEYSFVFSCLHLLVPKKKNHL